MKDEELSALLKELVETHDKEDRVPRERQILVWREMKLMWEGFRKYYYDAVAHDWRIWDTNATYGEDTQQDAYDKPINVFRAYLESIFAALSVVTPPVEAYPDDADNPLDILTAKAATRASILIDKHNDASLKWLHGLFVYGTEGMTACYIRRSKDKKYGTYKIDTWEDQEEEHEYTKCPNCGYELDDKNVTGQPPVNTEEQSEPNQNIQLQQGQEEQVNPQAEQVEEKLEQEKDDWARSIENPIQEMCPQCMSAMIPHVMRENVIIPKLVKTTHEPKSRIKFDIYGGLNVKVPNYARNQEQCPYLIFYEEINFVDAFDLFDKDEYSHDELLSKLRTSTGPRDYLDWARLSPQYNGYYPKDVVTVKRCWLRPNVFNSLENDKCTLLKKKFPDGVCVTLVNDCFASAYNVDLDSEWELTYNPLSDFIHFNPTGLLLTSVQELTNDIISLVVQTIEHGISQTFADPGVLNFNAYRQMETVPGAIYEATPKSGKSVSDGFYEIKTSTLSGEVLPFLQNLQSLGQLASGALPSIFGGEIAGSDTASEYSMSRAQALQRLKNTWTIMATWWKNIYGKSIPMFLDCVREQGDEGTVQKNADGNFFNVLIRKSELEGKIGSIELEASEQLPVTWGQKRDAIMKLLESGNPEVLSILGTPENLPFIREAIGIDQFIVPGEADRNKQFDEIKQLLNSEPIQMPDGTELPSVEIDPDFDDNDVEFATVRGWVVSEVGQQAKIDNPVGFKNVLLHGKMHLQAIQMKAMQQLSTGSDGSNPAKPDGTNEVNDEPATVS